MAKRAKTFDELCENRKKWVEISKDNDFDEGLLKLLTELYPDKAHFVYELLQNAEDAKATKVSFKLYKDRLEFVHNGLRLFNLEDIDSITSIANTTKTKEDHSIGKFGVGFKAVFSYTKTPQIHSGDWSFEIDNLVVPTPIKPLKDIDSNKTYFIFPFNNPKKASGKAYTETADGLRKLKPETLLFLNNIQELSYEINKECYRIYKQEEDHIVSLYQDNQANPVAKYLRFVQDNIKLETSNGLMKRLSVALAYKLEEDNDKRLKIVPISPSESNVFIYFPAEKENSKLRFLINAPFDSEVSRASIRDTDDNALLINEIADLQIETMEYLRDNGYLTTEFLGVLPNSQDKLSEMYGAFHRKLLDLFNTENYTPTISGEFHPANELFRGSTMYTGGPHIAEFISDAELVKMLDADGFEYNLYPPLWAKNAMQNSSPADLFLQDLDIRKFGVKEFYNWLCDVEWNDDKREVWKEIIERKEFNDLVKLYRMLYKYMEEDDESAYDFDSLLLFRCIDGAMYSKNDKIYILPEGEIPEEIIASYNFIDKKSFGTSKQKNDVYCLFTQYFEIEEFSSETIEQEKFEKIYNRYNKKKYLQKDNNIFVSPSLTTDDISVLQHIGDIKFLLKYYDDNRENYDLKSRLKSLSFILTSDNEYVSIDKVYSDIRYGNKHDLMVEAKDILGLSEINIAYKDKLESKQVEKFISILEDLGIHKLLWVKKVDCWKNPQSDDLRSIYNCRWDTQINRDAQIYMLPIIIENIRNNPKLSELIWKSVLDVNTEEFSVDAYYRANRQDPGNYVPSQYVYTLSKTAWILTHDGILQKPEDVTFDDLPDRWIRPKLYYEHPILKAIGFGKNTQKQREEQKRKDQLAQELGLENAAYVEKAKRALELIEKLGGEEACLNEVRKRERTIQDLPEDSVKNPERRKEKIKQEKEDATPVTYTRMEYNKRTSDTPGERAARRQYLRDIYTDNDEKVMYCQMCHEEIPFKGRDGEYYFIATAIDKEQDVEHRAQYIALCPNCSEEYKEWVLRDDTKLAEIKSNIAEHPNKSNKPIEIEFDLHGEKHSIYFMGKHYLDMRTIVCPDADIDENQSHWESLENTNIPIESGDIVRHKDFGEGTVISVGSNFLGSTATVDFSGEIKVINCDRLDKKMK